MFARDIAVACELIGREAAVVARDTELLESEADNPTGIGDAIKTMRDDGIRHIQDLAIELSRLTCPKEEPEAGGEATE